MAVGLKEPKNLLPVPGLQLAACSSGIYQKTRLDTVLIDLGEKAVCAAVFTQNAFCAAPVQVARKHLQQSTPRFCLINAGNANAGTGERGINDTLQICSKLAEVVKCPTQVVLPFSTGVIGEYLPVEKIINSIPKLYSNLSDDAWLDGANAIMTTDTVAKAVSKKLNIKGEQITVTGMAKGSGMIKPDMATMLAFIATDAAVEKNILEKILNNSVAQSFNRICVDGDTSTNDACLLIATGERKLSNSASNNLIDQLQDAITEICMELAQSIVRDGEGATKFVTIDVERGNSREECLNVAYTIACSPLVKTAFYASDLNWGRILAAIGRSGLPDLDIQKISINCNGIHIIRDGIIAQDYSEESGQSAVSKEEILLEIKLGRGNAKETIWTCDLSHDYVKINAEYRT